MSQTDHEVADIRTASRGQTSVDCPVCGFGLWLPILGMTESEVGLHSDARFPGRCIVALRNHFDHFSDVPAIQLVTYMEEIQFVVDAIKKATGSSRVNVAILGNAESHVHAHLIPRHPAKELLPDKAPWEDPRPKEQLSPTEIERLTESIRSELERLLIASKQHPVKLIGRRKSPVAAPAMPDVPLFDLLSDFEPIH